MTELATKAQKLKYMSEIEDEGPLIIPWKRKEEHIVQRKQKTINLSSPHLFKEKKYKSWTQVHDT